MRKFHVSITKTAYINLFDKHEKKIFKLFNTMIYSSITNNIKIVNYVMLILYIIVYISNQ